MGGNPFQSVMLSDAVRERMAYSMGRCPYPAASTESSRRPLHTPASTTKDQGHCHHSSTTNNTRSNYCNNKNALQRMVGAVVVPELRGDETEAEAEEWMRRFFSWAMQERLSEDQALLVALEHLEDEEARESVDMSVGVGTRITTLQEFLEALCRELEFAAAGEGDFANYSFRGIPPLSTCMRGFSGQEKRREEESSRLRTLVPHMMQRFAQMQKTSCVRFSYRELAFATNVFSKANLLGENEVGAIYHGLLADKRPAAVRRLRKPMCCSDTTIQQLRREVTTLSLISHRSLLRLLGSCLEPDEPLLVYELEPRGSLMHHLQGGKGCRLDWETRFMIALDTADGMVHLHHACKPPLLHRNLRSSNILLDKDMRPKICDFGISRSMFKKEFCPFPETKFGYVDPSYVQTYRFTDKSDVYSFGVVLMELVTGQKAVDFSRPAGEVTLAAMALAQRRDGYATVADLFDPELQKLGRTCPATLHDVVLLALKCMALDMDTRPTMQQVADQLRMIQDREVIRQKRRNNEHMQFAAWTSDKNGG